jgi:murein DD-endopeptidase MepM/ murein hydrolase activator NlpD
LIAAACAAVTGPIATQARVVRADAAQRTVRLENGLVFAIVDTTAVGEFSRGQRVDVTGTGFGSPIGGANSGIADSVTAVDEGSPSDAEAGYLFLRIAPVQGFPPHSTAPLVLHQADAYARPSATLALERGARIAVVGSVANTPQPGPWTRYSAKIWMRTGLSTPHPIAEDMEPGDVPVDLPWSVPNGLAAELVFRVREQSCSGINPPVCGPFQKVREEVRPAQIYLRGSLCGAELSASAVDLEDNAGIEARSIAVTGMNLNFSVFEGGTGNTFAAENCALGPLLSFCSLSPPVPVGQNQPFPVYALEDYFPIHPLLGALGVMETGKVRARHGVYAPSGLRWPHVRGQRNGSSYRYSCRVPRVVRDVVDFCPGANEDSYYRHPFYPTVIDATRHWFMGRGTWDQNPGHSGLQSFAFDIGAEGFDPSDPHRIRAARAGRVSLLKEWSNTNDFACYEAGGTTGSPCDDGNYLYVRHQDGTFATYWHLTQNGVVPVLGDLVLRSSEIALAGNTGYSSAPHLHFHVQRLNGVDTSWSFRVRFQTAISTCSTWPNGDMSPSNNDPSVFY